jgi:signal transduction histidine kinase
MFGLNVCKMLVSKYNGKMFFKSKINKGSTFGFIMDMKHLESKSLIATSINQIAS